MTSSARGESNVGTVRNERLRAKKLAVHLSTNWRNAARRSQLKQCEYSCRNRQERLGRESFRHEQLVNAKRLRGVTLLVRVAQEGGQFARLAGIRPCANGSLP
jgi:hypothetical protein